MAPTLNLPDLLKATLELGGSDLHLSMGSPPQVRVDGHLKRLEGVNFRGAVRPAAG